MPVVKLNSPANIENAFVFWQKGTYSATSSAVGYPSVNAGTAETWSGWRGTSLPARLVVDLGSAQLFDSIGIAAHDLATSAATIQFSYSSDGVTYTNFPGATYTPMTNEDLIFIFPQIMARYVRVTITGALANIGVFAVSKRLEFECAAVLDYVPIQHSKTYTKEFTNSIKGQFLGNRVMATGAQTTVNLGFQTRAFVEGPMRPFEYHYNTGGTFFYAGTPSNMADDMGYCRADDEDAIVTVNYIEQGKFAEISFGVNAYVG